MEGITNKTEIHTPKYLPHEIIENILFRLPVKSILRFKAICKKWKIALSDPKFAETHLQRFNSSSCSAHLLADSNGKDRFDDFINEKFRVLSSDEFADFICHCDGLYLMKTLSGRQNGKDYVLKNPSRRTYKKIRYPYPFNRPSNSKFGICYDPLAKNYKVMIGDGNYYAIFYCGTNSWSKMKEMSSSLCNNSHYCSSFSVGVLLNGSIYWGNYSKDYSKEDQFEVICFDGRDEKFKNLHKLSLCGDLYNDLISSVDSLYAIPCNHYSRTLVNEIIVMKKVGDGDDAAWMELKIQMPFPCRLYIKALCFRRENKIIFEVSFGEKHLLYDVVEGSMTEIKIGSNLWFPNLLPHVENLFLL